MHPYAATPAVQPHLCLNLFSALAASREERNGGGDQPSLSGTIASIREPRSGQTSATEKRWSDTVQGEPTASYPALYSGSRVGAKPAPSGTASFCFPGSSQNKFVHRGKGRRTNFFRAPPGMHSLALGSRAHSLTS